MIFLRPELQAIRLSFNVLISEVVSPMNLRLQLIRDNQITYSHWLQWDQHINLEFEKFNAQWSIITKLIHSLMRIQSQSYSKFSLFITWTQITFRNTNFKASQFQLTAIFNDYLILTSMISKNKESCVLASLHFKLSYINFKKDGMYNNGMKNPQAIALMTV